MNISNSFFLGESGNLTCSFTLNETHPNVSINWYHNDLNINRSDVNILPLEVQDSNNVSYISTIMFENITLSDAGNYKCVVQHNNVNTSNSSAVCVNG